MTSKAPQKPIAVVSEEEWVVERRRRHMLVQMGITPVISRFDPPGAGVANRRYRSPSSQVDRPHRPFEREGKAAVETVRRPPMPFIEVESSAVGKTNSIAPRPALSDVGATQTAQVERPTFSLLIATAANYLWIEQLQEGLIVREQISLATAMAKAIQGVDAELHYRQFDWPIVDNPALPTDLNTAKQSLTAMIGRMMTEQATSGVIVMGTCDVIPELDASAIYRIPSTLAMLAAPALKGTAWETLKHLAHRR